MKNKEDFMKIVIIAQRSEGLAIGYGDRFTRVTDIEFAHEKFNLRLDDFLKADDENFIHDFLLIQANIDRQNKVWKDEFALPRYASN